MASTDRDWARQVAYFVVIIGGPAVFVLALLNPHPTALAWIEAALSAFLVAYAGYLVIRRRRRESAPRD